MMQTREPVIVDAHHHLWVIGRFDYAWMEPWMSVLRRDFMPGDMAEWMRETGVSQTVLVQAHQSPPAAEWELAVAAETPHIGAVVAWADLTAPDLGETLDRFAKNPKLRGIRHLIEFEDDSEWVLRPEVLRGLAMVRDRGLSYDVVVKPRHLPAMTRMAELVPGLSMVLDHIAKPFIKDGGWEPWASGLAAFAELPDTHCKVSGLVTEADREHWTVEDLRPYVQHVLACFGHERIMFGSDWPVCLLAAKSYGHVFDAALASLGPMTGDQRDGFLGGNAQRFYRMT